MENKNKLYIVVPMLLIIVTLGIFYYMFYIRSSVDGENSDFKDLYSPNEVPSNSKNVEELDDNNF